MKHGRNIIGTVLGLALRTRSTHAFLGPASSVPARKASSSSSLDMARNRGLERREEGATPLPGGMTLYVKPSEDGTSVGDCPFAHFVRMVLVEKGLEYDLVPSTPDAKPQWLLDDYGGKMPALRHRRECYVDSEVIAQYLDFFFKEPELSVGGAETERATAALEGLFPAMAKFVKHGPNGDDEDKGMRAKLDETLQTLEGHLSDGARTGPYLVGNGERFTLLDCSLAPQLYVLEVCLREIKENTVDLRGYPQVRKYMVNVFARPSFQSTVEYGPVTVVWDWTAQ